MSKSCTNSYTRSPPCRSTGIFHGVIGYVTGSSFPSRSGHQLAPGRTKMSRPSFNCIWTPCVRSVIAVLAVNGTSHINFFACVDFQPTFETHSPDQETLLTTSTKSTSHFKRISSFDTQYHDEQQQGSVEYEDHRRIHDTFLPCRFTGGRTHEAALTLLFLPLQDDCWPRFAPTGRAGLWT